jgi:hypothetical protein
MAKIKFPAVKTAKEHGYKFPYKYEQELNLVLENADTDWYGNFKDGVHKYFATYELCIGAYLEGFYNELKLN